ncbi:hypothetical protein [Kocuria rosea]|uniref:hypothetical protein n=1 Tax=Kocuria rosea TaxID=1275 RepID=UPI0025418608|nr:hypothetical protein [Kocuria rosea]WIG18388.1 hypothetical protein QOY29_05520 [Kocuria rosea]
MLWFYYVGNLVLTAGIVALSYFSHGWYTDFVPEPDELVFAVWTAVFAAVLATALQQLLRSPSLSTEQKLTAAQKDIGEDAWGYVEQTALDSNCDPTLMRAIVAAEALQRPRWMRHLERAKGRVVPEGSYGVAQMTASHPLSDAQSIQALCSEHAGYYPARSSAGHVRETLLEARIERHNSNPEFVASVLEFYRHLTPWAMDRSASISYDGRSHIEVTAVKRVGDQFEIEGTAVMADSQLYVGLVEGGEVRELVPVPTHAADERRQGWTVQIPLEASQVAFYECSGAGLDESDSVVVDLEYR